MNAAELLSNELIEVYHVETDLCGTDTMMADELDISAVSAALWSRALLGSCELPQETGDALIDASQETYAKLMNQVSIALRLEEEDILCLALVELTKRFDAEETEGKLWDYLSRQLGYYDAKSAVSRQILDNKLRELLVRTFRRHDRYVAEQGQRYYTTLHIHALSPTWSVEHLLNILYGFYKTNLRYQYTKGDASFQILVSKIARRWTDADQSETEEDRLRADSVASGFKMLFQYRPHYMAAVCDSLIGKLDALLAGNDPALDRTNRWDHILLDWYNGHPEGERRSMKAGRQSRSGQAVVTRRENIRPEYCLEGGMLYLCLPGIRLPEIDRPPVLELYQGGRLISSQTLRLFGDNLCWTTQETRLLLTETAGINWSQAFTFSLRLYCGERVLYHSDSELLRIYLVFDAYGKELRNLPKGLGQIWLLVNSRTQVDFPLDEEHYPERHPGLLYRLSTATAQQTLVNGDGVLAGEKKQSALRVFLTREPEMLVVRCGDQPCQVFSAPPDVRVFLREQAAGKQYTVIADGVRRPLYSYGEQDGRVQIPMPKMPRYQHSFQIKDFETGSPVFALDYIILNDFSYRFDQPFYLDQWCEGKITLRMGGSAKTLSFQMEPGQREGEFLLWDPNYTAVIPIPKLEVSLGGENALTMRPWIWYKELRQSGFVSVRCPEGITAALMLGGQTVPALRNGCVFELGNYLDTKSDWGPDPLPLGVLLRSNGTLLDPILLTEVLFQPDFTGSPVCVEGRRITWEPENCYRGMPDAEMFLLLENDQEPEPWRYAVTVRASVLEKKFPCRDGHYRGQVFWREKKGPFAKVQDRLLWEGTITIGEPERSRWLGKELHLTVAHYSLNDSSRPQTALLQTGGAIVTGLCYIGRSVPEYLDGVEAMSEFQGILQFENRNGRRFYFGGSRDSSDREWINPLRLWLGDGGGLYIQTANGTALMVNMKRPPDIKTVRIVERTAGLTDSDWDHIFSVDFFDFEERAARSEEDYI